MLKSTDNSNRSDFCENFVKSINTNSVPTPMHGFSIKTVTDLIRALPVGFPVLFSISVGCTSTHECDVKKPEVRDQDSSKDVAGNGQPNTQKKDGDSAGSSDPETLKVFKDDNGFLTRVMAEVFGVFKEYFESVGLADLKEYQAHKNEIWEVVAMHLCRYNLIIKEEVSKRSSTAVIKRKIQ
ncbi:uncharacterized protein VICG_01753, partial [Vittaforma corneae ATCC 50505]